MTDQQIRLYAECRVRMPSPMIRLRSGTDLHGRLWIEATRQPFRVPRPTYPRVELREDLRSLVDHVRVDAFEPQREVLGVDHFLLDDERSTAAEVLAEQVCQWPDPEINIRL